MMYLEKQQTPIQSQINATYILLEAISIYISKMLSLRFLPTKTSCTYKISCKKIKSNLLSFLNINNKSPKYFL